MLFAVALSGTLVGLQAVSSSRCKSRKYRENIECLVRITCTPYLHHACRGIPIPHLGIIIIIIIIIFAQSRYSTVPTCAILAHFSSAARQAEAYCYNNAQLLCRIPAPCFTASLHQFTMPLLRLTIWFGSTVSA
jgi:hypothetical protein